MPDYRRNGEGSAVRRRECGRVSDYARRYSPLAYAVSEWSRRNALRFSALRLLAASALRADLYYRLVGFRDSILFDRCSPRGARSPWGCGR
jgi:hypothetical protein